VHKLILDCDPGRDDAIAIVCALARPELSVLGITCVAGNVAVDKTYSNACDVVEYVTNDSVPIFSGCSHPILLRQVTAEDIHGETGLRGIELPHALGQKTDVHAVDFILDQLKSNEPETITLCCTAPLTNIAVAFLKEPHILRRAQQIIIMGGSFGIGNISPVAEFNAYCDPLATKIVFGSNVPILLFPLNLTQRFLIRKRAFDAIGNFRGKGARLVWGLLDADFDDDLGRIVEPLHDPCTVLSIANSAILRSSNRQVAISVGEGPERGRMTILSEGDTGAEIEIVEAIDWKKLVRLFLDSLSRI